MIRFSNLITGKEAKELLLKLSKYCRIVMICDYYRASFYYKHYLSYEFLLRENIRLATANILSIHEKAASLTGLILQYTFLLSLKPKSKPLHYWDRVQRA